MMQKKLMILAVSAFAFLGVNAQNNNNCGNCAETPCAEAPCQKNCDKPCGAARCLRQFEGLGLTDAQKTQLIELNKARAAEFKALRKDCRDKKNRCDSTARVDRRAAQAKYLAELKKVLTPEQYTQFLENAYLNGGRNLKVKAQMRGKHHAMFGDRKFKKDCQFRAVKADKVKDANGGKDKNDKKDKK